MTKSTALLAPLLFLPLVIALGIASRELARGTNAPVGEIAIKEIEQNDKLRVYQDAMQRCLLHVEERTVRNPAPSNQVRRPWKCVGIRQRFFAGARPCAFCWLPPINPPRPCCTAAPGSLATAPGSAATFDT
jgi:hypothetical protein